MVNKSLQLLVRQLVMFDVFPRFHILGLPILPAMHNLANRSCCRSHFIIKPSAITKPTALPK